MQKIEKAPVSHLGPTQILPESPTTPRKRVTIKEAGCNLVQTEPFKRGIQFPVSSFQFRLIKNLGLAWFGDTE
ncbi:MAG: hypothetical protein DRJ61_04480 [Acidobacteria bacterium]|nr:MAG: hypothetical protein DRJ61_04480 [Acidobacteriota bacterium]